MQCVLCVCIHLVIFVAKIAEVLFLVKFPGSYSTVWSACPLGVFVHRMSWIKFTFWNALDFILLFGVTMCWLYKSCLEHGQEQFPALVVDSTSLVVMFLKNVLLATFHYQYDTLWRKATLLHDCKPVPAYNEQRCIVMHGLIVRYTTHIIVYLPRYTSAFSWIHISIVSI